MIVCQSADKAVATSIPKTESEQNQRNYLTPPPNRFYFIIYPLPEITDVLQICYTGLYANRQGV